MKKFKPKPGQIDFTHVRFVPVVICVVQFGKKILLVKRSAAMNVYPGFWNSVGGYLDDKKRFKKKQKKNCEKKRVLVRTILFRSEQEIFLKLTTRSIRKHGFSIQCS